MVHPVVGALDEGTQVVVDRTGVECARLIQGEVVVAVEMRRNVAFRQILVRPVVGAERIHREWR